MKNINKGDSIFKNDVILKWGIAQKFILSIFLFNIFITLFLTGIYLYMEYRQGREAIENKIQQLKASYIDGIVSSMRVSDMTLLQTQLEGLVKSGDIRYVNVIHGNELLAQAGIPGEGNTSSREFELPYTYRNKTIGSGSLQVFYTLENLYTHLKSRAIDIIIFQAIIIIFISGFIFLIFYLLVARHIYALVDYTASLKINTLTIPFSLKRRWFKWGEDELDVLSRSINKMRTNLNISYARLKETIAETVEAKAALKGSEVQLRSLIDSLPDLVWLKDPHGVYISCNAKFERFFGASEAEIVGKTDYDFVDCELADFFREKDKKAIVAGKPCINEEVITYADDGHREFLETVKAPMYDRHGHLMGVLGVGRDITERKKAAEERIRLETRLQQSHKMESLGTLAGGIAHDFNNILSPILGYTEMLLEDLPREETMTRQALAEVYAATLRARELIKQILTFSRQETGALKFMRMQPVVKEALKLIRSSIPTTIDIKQEIHPECDVIKADPTQIHQVVMNLCTNAYHAIPESGGQIHVSLKPVNIDASEEMFPGMEKGQYNCLTVSDTGMGMDKALQEKIFDPYFTTKKQDKGTGMGLSVVHGIVNGMGGAVKVYSEPGKGSEFQVYFPVVRSLVKPHSSLMDMAVQGGTERILIVDDEKSIINMTKQMLERLGYAVTALDSSIETLNLFKTDPHGYDLIITDFAMPHMGGDRLAAELLAIRSDIPIILNTGFNEKMTPEQVKAIGIRGMLMKPVTTTNMARMVRSVLDEAGDRALNR